jgi:hypothetical protein
LSLVPWRNFRRVAFLILALMAVVVLKRSGPGFFRGLFDSVGGQPPPRAPATETTVHLRQVHTAGPDQQ